MKAILNLFIITLIMFGCNSQQTGELSSLDAKLELLRIWAEYDKLLKKYVLTEAFYEDLSQNSQILDEELKKIDRMVAWTKYDIDDKQHLYCSYKQSSENAIELLHGKNSEKINRERRMIEGFLEESSLLCELYMTFKYRTEENYLFIKRHQLVPSEYAMFSIYLPFEDDEENVVFSKKYIGIFATIQECQQVELLARKQMIATKACQLWNDAVGSSFLFQSYFYF